MVPLTFFNGKSIKALKCVFVAINLLDKTNSFLTVLSIDVTSYGALGHAPRAPTLDCQL